MSSIIALYGNVPPKFLRSVTGLSGSFSFFAQPDDPDNVWIGRPFKLASGGLLVGNSSELQQPFTPYSVIARSDNSGVTWYGTVLSSEFPNPTSAGSDAWAIHQYAELGSGVVLVGGKWTNDSYTTTGFMLRSTDGGKTFTRLTTITTATSPGPGASATDTLTVDPVPSVGANAAMAAFIVTSADCRLFKTTDGGTTWAEMTLPAPDGSTRFIVNQFLDLGTRILAVGGSFNVIGDERPAVWTSTNGGTSWSVNSTPVTGLTYPSFDPEKGGSQRSHFIIAAKAMPGTTGGVLIAMEGNPLYDNFRWLRLSEDYGSTFPLVGNYQQVPTVLVPAGRFAEAQDGALLLPIGESPVSGSVIFRSVLSGGNFTTESVLDLDDTIKGASESTALTPAEAAAAAGLTSVTLRGRTVWVSEKDYTYTWQQNSEDFGQKGARALTIEVRGRTFAGELGEVSRIRVSNPIPDMSSVLPTVTSPNPKILFVDWSSYIPLDKDFDYYEVRYGQIYDPDQATFSGANATAFGVVRRDANQNNVLIPDLPDKSTIYIQVVPYDLIGEGIGTPVFSGVTL